MKISKSEIKTLIIILLICAICTILVFFLSIKSNSDRLAAVTEYNTFFSANKYANNYLNYLSNRNNASIYNLIYKDYIEKNNVTEDNILNTVDIYTDSLSLKIKSMDYVEIKDNYAYYIQGSLIQNNYDSKETIKDNFQIFVLTDFNNLTFAVYPLKNNDNYKKIIDNIKEINIPKNSTNAMTKTASITKDEVCILYLSDFVDKLFNDLNSSYTMLNDNMKKLYPNINSYQSYIESKINKITTGIDSCKVESGSDGRTYSVIDKNKNRYIFNESSILNYKAEIYLYEDIATESNNTDNSVDNTAENSSSSSEIPDNQNE